MDLFRSHRLEWSDAFAEFSGNMLTIGNGVFSRTTDFSQGFPRTVSMIFQGKELAGSDKKEADCSFIGLPRPGKEYTLWSLDGMTAETKEGDLFDAGRLEITAFYHDDWSGARYTRTFLVYPGQPFFSVRCGVTSPIQPVLYWNYRQLRSAGNATREDPGNLESRVDSIRPAPSFHPVQAVEFCGRSDYSSVPVKKHPIAADTTANGNLLFFENDAGAGFAWLQEAPPSEERLDMEGHDFVCRDGEWASCGWGIAPGEVQRGTSYTSHRHTTVFFENALEQQTNIKNYIRTRFPMQDGKLCSIVNPWGCGRFPEYVSPQFLTEDIQAAAECGADAYQIDDSWQQGNGLGDITQGKNITLDFWKISPSRMNGSFEPQIKAAQKAGVQLALWMAPSTNTELDDWEEFAALILDYHRKYGFCFFKLDGLCLRTYRATANMEALLRKIRMESQGKIYVNLDTTNGQRCGFLLFQEYGNIFLENRYLWFPRCAYQPEQTLRSLWTLSEYLRPERLQIEIPAPEDMTDGTYAADNRPTRYPLDYWCAIALFASPLIWTAPSKLPEQTRAVYRRFLELHRNIRPNLLQGNIYPVGHIPDGKSYCGFLAEGGYLLVFREYGCQETSCILTGKFPPGDYVSGDLLAGQGTVAVRETGFHCAIPTAPGYALFALRR